MKEWETEPDSYEWTSPTGFKCKWSRHPHLKHLCGYVILPKGHKYHGVHFDDIPASVHGGLTYSEKDDNGNWVVGFDCAHFNDFVPGAAFNNKGARYRNRKFVEAQTERLAIQFLEEEDS